MGTLNDIRQKLISGYTVSQLIGEGYAKSSVNHVARKLKVIQPGTPASPVSDELQELRHRREIIKIQKEIADLEAAKERLPERVAKLEVELHQLSQQLPEFVENCYASLYMAILRMQGWNKDEAQQEAKSVANGFLEYLKARR